LQLQGQYDTHKYGMVNEEQDEIRRIVPLCYRFSIKRYIEPTDMCEIEEEPGPQKGRETKRPGREVFFGGFPTYLSASEQAG